MFFGKWTGVQTCFSGRVSGEPRRRWGGRGPPLTLFQDYVPAFLIFTRLRRDPAAGKLGLDSIFGSSWNDQFHPFIKGGNVVPAAAHGKKEERRHRQQRDARRFLGRCRPAFPWPRGGVARTQPVNSSRDDESRWRTAERRRQASPYDSHVHVGSRRPQTR